jgi:phage pi2 protein 07
MKIKLLVVLSVCLFISSCKTFILYSGDISLELNKWTTDKTTERMCITTTKIINSDTDKCILESSTMEVDLFSGGLIFPVDKYFIKRGFDDRRLRKSLDEEFKKDYLRKAGSVEGEVLYQGLNWLFDGAMESNVQENIYKKKQADKKRKEELIDNSLNTFFGDAYKRLNESSSDSGIGIKIKFYTYESDNDTYGLAELSFVDMKNSNTVMGNTVLGYFSTFSVGRGGINVYIPSCFVVTSKVTDGCSSYDINKIKERVRKSQKYMKYDGKPLITFSLATYIPPPEEPKAQGIPLDI